MRYEGGVSQYHLQLAVLLHYVAHPPPLGRLIHEAPWRACRRPPTPRSQRRLLCASHRDAIRRRTPSQYDWLLRLGSNSVRPYSQCDWKQLNRGYLMSKAKLYRLVILCGVAGCSTQPATNHVANNANAAADVQCRSVQVTGSMLGKTVCTTQAERDAQQRDNEALRSIVDSQPYGCRGGGQCSQ
jgi:hypothetical protein